MFSFPRLPLSHTATLHAYRPKRWYVLGGIVLVLCLCYGLFQARDLIRGPTLVIESPTNGASVHEAFMTIQGSTAHISKIELNDRPIFVDETGNFEEAVLLYEGYNILTVRVEDRFGRELEEQLEVVYSPDTINEGVGTSTLIH